MTTLTLCVTCKPEKQLIRGDTCTENCFLKSLQISKKLPIMERDYSNAAGATLFKSLSTMDNLV